jgi:hypothetical protein
MRVGLLPPRRNCKDRMGLDLREQLPHVLGNLPVGKTRKWPRLKRSASLGKHPNPKIKPRRGVRTANQL